MKNKNSIIIWFNNTTFRYILKELKAASQRDIYTSIFLAAHSNIICNHQNVKATQVSNYGWIEKQNMVYTHSGILFILKKNRESDTCFSMNESWKYYAKWNSQSSKDRRLRYFVLQDQTCLLLQIYRDFLLLHHPLRWKGHIFLVLVLESPVGLHRTIQLQFLLH